jgi:hypothetical protein
MMVERFGAKGTVLDDIFFTEQPVVSGTVLSHLHVEISRQNSNLLEVKRELARQVRACGGNTLANFRYGQRKHDWWELVFTFKWDTESWHGEGDAVRAE